MTELFLKIFNMSIAASWMVLAVIVVRFCLKKAPKWVNPVLWTLVGFKLICPFSIESVLSLIPSGEVISPEVVQYSPAPTINSGVEVINSYVNPVISEAFAPAPGASVNPLYVWTTVAGAIWVIGLCLMLLYMFLSFYLLKRKLGTAVRYQSNIYQSEYVTTPFILGMMKPKIYLPFHMEEKDYPYVIAHEMAHIKRRDHLIKPLSFLLLSVYWFNPFMWISYILLCRDIELACDEKVIKDYDIEDRADYSEALLTLSVSHRHIGACPLAFGETGVKDRVKSVLSYKKPTFWVIGIALVSCLVVAICFLTNPENVLDIPAYPLTKEAVEEIMRECDFPENLVVGDTQPVYDTMTTKTDYTLTMMDGMYSLDGYNEAFGDEQYSLDEYNETFGEKQYSLDEYNETFGNKQYTLDEYNEVFSENYFPYDGDAMRIQSQYFLDNRHLHVQVRSLDAWEELSEEECKKAIEFATCLYGGFKNKDRVYTEFAKVWKIDESLDFKEEIDGINVNIAYVPYGENHIAGIPGQLRISFNIEESGFKLLY